MPHPTLHKFVDDGSACFANLTLRSGERVFLSIAAKGLALFRLHLGGRVPGRRLYAVDGAALMRMRRVLARDAARLPALPRGRDVHRDEGAMAEFLDAALADLAALNAGQAVPGRVEALDAEHPEERPLSLMTRLALTANDAADCIRLFARAQNTAG
jgi:hypothetical protein